VVYIRTNVCVCVCVCGLLSNRKAVVQHLIQSFQRSSGSALAKTFRVNYKRHVLTMDDLGTLYGQNWLNDQVERHAGAVGDDGF